MSRLRSQPSRLSVNEPKCRVFHLGFWAIIALIVSFPLNAASVPDCSLLNKITAELEASVGTQQQKAIAKRAFVYSINCENSTKLTIAAAYILGGRENPLVNIGIAIQNFREAGKLKGNDNFKHGIWPDTVITQLNVGRPSSERDLIFLIAAFYIQFKILKSQPDPHKVAEQIKANFIDTMRASLAIKSGFVISADEAVCFILNDTKTTQVEASDYQNLTSCEL